MKFPTVILALTMQLREAFRQRSRGQTKALRFGLT
jgi:hypothetical protein